MRSRTVTVAMDVALAGALIGLPGLVGCSTNTTGPPTGPAAAPVNTSPEPLDNPAIQVG